MNDSPRNRDRLRRLLIVGGLAVVLAGAAIFYLLGGRYVSTDDAYVQAARANISANISGRVGEVLVRDNQPVQRGEPLFELDSRPLVIALEDAQARLASARMEVAALKATYGQRLADLRSSQATVAYRQRELVRATGLAARGIAPQAQLDKARHDLAEARQKAKSLAQEAMNVRALLGGNPGIAVGRHPLVLQAKAALDRARLNLSYAVIRAPFDGIVAKVDGLQVGDYIKAGAPVFALVANKRIWVAANFKESELAHVRPGEDATTSVDAYPGHRFHGKVESLSPGTGSSFSLLPPENATGNWVKVVQRLPVRISIDDAGAKWPLHAGLSATVEVDTGRSRLQRFR